MLCDNSGGLKLTTPYFSNPKVLPQIPMQNQKNPSYAGSQIILIPIISGTIIFMMTVLGTFQLLSEPTTGMFAPFCPSILEREVNLAKT
jgi:hypothetical protein